MRVILRNNNPHLGGLVLNMQMTCIAFQSLDFLFS